MGPPPSAAPTLQQNPEPGAGPLTSWGLALWARMKQAGTARNATESFSSYWGPRTGRRTVLTREARFAGRLLSSIGS
jgi:hypothetical protein